MSAQQKGAQRTERKLFLNMSIVLAVHWARLNVKFALTILQQKPLWKIITKMSIKVAPYYAIVAVMSFAARQTGTDTSGKITTLISAHLRFIMRRKNLKY